MLGRTAAGFGAVGLSTALQSAGFAQDQAAPPGTPHFVPKAKRVIQLFMNGAPSHVDTFDPKPALARYEGQMPEGEFFKKPGAGFKSSPFKFAAHGQSGVVMSELFPHLSGLADDLCVIRSMHTAVPNHEPGLLMMLSGNIQPIRPSIGSWVSYGLGTENENLPSYVVLCPGLPVVGPQLWSNSFLPGSHQGTSIDTNDLAVDRLIANLNHPTLNRSQQRRQLDLLHRLNEIHLQKQQNDARLESQIRAMELAFSMQREASVAFDVSRESEKTRERYGRTVFGQSCLLARRLIEHGVRYTQVYYVSKGKKQPWDTHSNNDAGHRTLCADSDQATAALLIDLKERGLLDDTLVIWGGEFGRTPYAQVNKQKDPKKVGRDHHHTGFSMFLAGGGVRGGLMYGATDEFGLNAVQDRVHVHDLHATILHQLGVDHTRLTYRYSGRDFRLTDVHGEVVHGLLA
jgi:hypothetical protein